jgi:hypothetical protein
MLTLLDICIMRRAISLGIILRRIHKRISTLIIGIYTLRGV